MFRIVVLRHKEHIVQSLQNDGCEIGSWLKNDNMIVRATHKEVQTQEDMRNRLLKLGLLTSINIRVEEIHQKTLEKQHVG